MIRSCVPTIMVLGPEDLVITKGAPGKVVAGFTLSALAADRGDPAVTLHGGGGNNPVKLEGLAVPAPLALSKAGGHMRHKEEEGGVATDGLIDQLTALASFGRPRAPQKRKRMTRRSRRPTSKRKSRRHAR